MALTRITTNELSDNVVVKFANTSAFSQLSARVDSSFSIANTANNNAGGLIPKITNVQYANSSYTVLDDTNANINSSNYLVITGSGFVTGAQVLIDITPATSTTVVSSTVLRAEIPAKSAGTYNLYVVNEDGGTATKVGGITYSGTPTWVSTSPLSTINSGEAFSGSLSATGATSYAVASGSSLPSGMTLLANGYYYGTVTVGSQTTYNFTINAIDAEKQDSPQTFSLSVLTGVPVEYLVVAGGGSGGAGAAGWRNSGGGGAGGLLSGSIDMARGGTTTITVGAGGADRSKGSNSSFGAIALSLGGGYGGSTQDVYEGSSGGSGGGSYIYAADGGAGTPGQGNKGGAGYGPSETSGGGGGAGAAGENGKSGAGGAGGIGIQSSISGTATYYAGGGGALNALGGQGGGADGSSGGGTGGVNTGGGGGGSGYFYAFGPGGSGIVILRYPDSFAAATTTGSPTVTTSGGYRIYKFTGSGSITL